MIPYLPVFLVILNSEKSIVKGLFYPLLFKFILNRFPEHIAIYCIKDFTPIRDRDFIIRYSVVFVILCEDCIVVSFCVCIKTVKSCNVSAVCFKYLTYIAISQPPIGKFGPVYCPKFIIHVKLPVFLSLNFVLFFSPVQAQGNNELHL